MKQGCKFCKYNMFDHINMGTNICDKDRTHINPYSEGYCDGFEPRDAQEPKNTADDLKNPTVDQLVKINIEQIDQELYNLLTYINRVDGIITTSSCFGHGQRPCTIFCEADSIETLHKFMYDYFYNDRLWSIRLYITDTMIDNQEWGKVSFIIQTDKCIDYTTSELMVELLTGKFWKYQTCSEFSSKLLLPVDMSVKLEDVIKAVIEEEAQHG